MRCFLTLVFGQLAGLLGAQVLVQGRVVDVRTLEPLAFVHVLPGDGSEGATSDIDGRFAVRVVSMPARLRFSYVGYAPLTLEFDQHETGVVRMERTAIALRGAVVVAGENPAHRIIQGVRANRFANDAMRNRAHRYTSYSRTILTAAVDSTLLNDPERMAKLDSGDRQAIDFLDRQHLLLIESATRKSFIPPAGEKEEVLAMRVSGLKDPSLLAPIASTKTFSIYEPQVRISEKSYLSPIGPNSTDRYLFVLEDTLLQGRDSVFVISYQPRLGRNFDALKGILWVNTDGYALQNVIAEPVERDGGTGIKLQQRFERVKGVWFPVQLNTFLYLGQVRINSMAALGIGRTYLKDIEVDAPVTRKEVRGPELLMDRLAARRDSGFWTGVRADTLAVKDLRTYHVIDSVSEAEGLEKKLKWAERLLTGRLPIGPFDLRLDQLLRYNGYEGLRLGMGVATNDRITRYASLGGYYAYGFVDRASKYGGDLTIKPRPGIGPELKLYYDLDVAESGGVAFPGARTNLADPDGYRWFYVDRMDRQERAGAELSWRLNSQLKLWVATERNDRENLRGYQLAEPMGEGVTLLSDRFLTGTISLGARFAFREQLVRVPERQFVIPSKWPVLHVKVMRAVEGLWTVGGRSGGERELWRVDAMIEKSFRLRMLGELSLRAMGGMADNQSPYAFLYNLRGTNDPKLPIGARNTFETMRPNEFLADRYAALHLRHSLGNLLFKGKRWKPVPVLVANAAWGAIDRPERHRGSGFTPMTDGYYEAGLQMDNLLRSGFTGIGVGAYWRFGPLALPEPMDNLVVKATMGLVF
ncbi:MAG: carboxypeptidase-like regulatory domain-containing protein [Flavobacteriales bacterium]|nr:carboxypeptidase-like regulatory domain-containing protein [Flavobacteriales bacterium]